MSFLKKFKTFKFLKQFASIALLLSLIGCSANLPLPFLSGIGQQLPGGGGTTATSGVPRGPAIEIQEVTIVADNNANDNTAVPVEFIVAYDQGVFVELMSMTARDYFQRSAQIKNDYPNIIQTWRWEVIPGQTLNNQPVKVTGDDPVGAVVFADYTSQGDHRIRVGAGEHVRIHLKESAFTLAIKN